jgi:hypothetical protein
MKNTLILGTALALSGLWGCGNPDTGSGGQGGFTLTLTPGGTGGMGGSTTVSTSTTTTTSSDTTSSSTGIEIGPGADCDGDVPISPIDGAADEVLAGFPLVDEGGATLFEDGALACKRVVPPYTPFTVDDWTLTLGVGFNCTLPPAAVSFVAPKDAVFPITLGPDASLVEQTLSGETNPAMITSGLTITDETFAFYACARLTIADAGDRSCISGCRHKGDVIAQNALYSNTTGGHVTPLPILDLELVSVSPTGDAAVKLHNVTLDWNITVHGH